jgi:hypothetical protein
MKNHKIFLSLFLIFLTGIINFVHAQDIPLGPEICNILRWLKNIMIGLSVLFIIFYGYQMMSAGGDVSKIEGAKKGILWVLIAIAIILTVTSTIKMVNKEIPVCSGL